MNYIGIFDDVARAGMPRPSPDSEVGSRTGIVFSQSAQSMVRLSRRSSTKKIKQPGRKNRRRF